MKNKFFTREICVCAHLTQTRYAQKTCAERGQVKMSEIGNIAIHQGRSTSEIGQLMSQSANLLSEAQSGYAALSASLSHSKGDYIDALKEQIDGEMQVVTAVAGFFQELLQNMQAASTDFSSLDQNYVEILD